jgi:maltose alpha-D-glucosyltransferase/alpha-amylase
LTDTVARSASRHRPTRRAAARRNGDPTWYKDAIIYEVHVRAFFDRDGNGLGDFQGLTSKLDYLADLGVTAIWLLPFYPSPGRDDGYDIADYREVNPDYGTLRDLKVFVREAHKRGLRVITELVCNHTSDQHPWFKRARTAPPGSPARDFYVWSDTPDRYADARIIFKDTETSNWSWDPVAGAYYWHRFFSHQPDLNFDNPRVREAIFSTLDYWLGMGIDGLRLDAIPYLYEREGTNGENLPETHAFLAELRRYVDERYGDRMLLAEANQWPEEAVAYLGTDDDPECHMAFHFPVMPRLFMAIRMEDRFPIVDILDQTPSIPAAAQWALFLRNHDELTLEMVTDEERDFMYRAYASDPQARLNLGIRRRLAPLLGNNRRRIELMNGLLFALPGTPVVYYGDEIGMGDNVYLGDRNGVRTPMQWSPDRNAGFSTANRQRLYLPPIVDPEYHYEAVNVEAQLANPHSLLWWMRRLISLRRRHPAFGRGTTEIVGADNRRIFAFVRRFEDETLLVVANLSRYVQWSTLDLAAFEGMTPVELFGSVEFPPIASSGYQLTLGPHSFYWFSLRAATGAPADGRGQRIRSLERPRSLISMATGSRAAELSSALAEWITERRWYRGHGRRVRSTRIADAIPVNGADGRLVLVLLQVTYSDGEPELYAVPRGIVEPGEREPELGEVVAWLTTGQEPAGALVDAAGDAVFATWLVGLLSGRRKASGRGGTLVGRPTAAAPSIVGSLAAPTVVEPLRGEQSNTSVRWGETGILKLYRVVESGENPEIEMGRTLTQRGFAHAPATAGWIEYRTSQSSSSLAILQAWVGNRGDAFGVAQSAIDGYLETVISQGTPAPDVTTSISSLLARARRPADDTPTAGLVGSFLVTAELLGQRTGQLHRSLALATDDPAFKPDRMTPFHQRSLYQSVRGSSAEAFRLLRSRLDGLPAPVRDQAESVLSRAGRVDARLRRLLDTKPGGTLIRCHGDYHAGQVLVTADDVMITDFEGEPLQPISQRRLKRPALVDVAGMLRSLHYAAAGTVLLRGELQTPELERWATAWYAESAAAFLRGYLAETADTGLLPADDDATAILLDVLLLQKAAYELRYELGARPTWVTIPLRGLDAILDDDPSAET